MKSVLGVIDAFSLRYLCSDVSENYYGKSFSIVNIKLHAQITFFAFIIVLSLSFIYTPIKIIIFIILTYNLFAILI